MFGVYAVRSTSTWSVDDIISGACLVYDNASRLAVCVSQCLLLMGSARPFSSLSQEEGLLAKRRNEVAEVRHAFGFRLKG